MKKLLALVLVIGAVVSFVTPLAVSAQILPPEIGGLGNVGGNLSKNPGSTVNTVVTNGMTVLFIVVFVVAVFYTFMAAIKYIRSEGNEQKVEEAKNAIKAVLFGVAAMFIAIIGILLINAFFGGSGGDGNALSKAIDSILAPFRGTAK
mgnify:CR=1 FL=1